jgi:hypothetical protein
MIMSTNTHVYTFQQKDDSPITLPKSFVELKEYTADSEPFSQKLQSFLEVKELKKLGGPAAAEVADFLDEVLFKSNIPNSLDRH